MDNAAKNFANTIICELEKIAQHLAQLTSKPRQNDPKPISQANNTGNEYIDSNRDTPQPIGEAPTQRDQTSKKTKPAAPQWEIWLARTGIIAGIGYAVVTFFMWYDSGNNFRLDQRAWIGPKGATGSPPFKIDAPNLMPGQPYTMGIIVGNFGKTPALHVKGSTDMKILPKDTPFSPEYRPIPDAYIHGDATLVPGGTLAMMAPTSAEPISGRDLEDLLRSSKVLYLYGSYTYDDIFGKSHSVTICMFATPQLNAMASCNTYNKAD